jgi:hypothetical protein
LSANGTLRLLLDAAVPGANSPTPLVKRGGALLRLPSGEPNNDPVFLDPKILAPGGTTIPHGVGVLGLGPIGMSITATIPETLDTSELAGGTFNGGGFSSATNWETKANSYQIQLYCTQDPNVTYAPINPVTS